MKRRGTIAVFSVLVIVAAGSWAGLSRVSLSALEEPGRLETLAATQAKRFLIGRAARGQSQTASGDSMSVPLGRGHFVGRCASCHGLDGRSPADIGRAMYPRSSDLGSPETQEWSDAEFFWIIKNGVRLTGMPGFGNILSDRDIWALVLYVRSLGATAET